MNDHPDGQRKGSDFRPRRAGQQALLARALSRARWSIFWERLWPALAGIATVIGLFLAVSWLGLWLWLPPIGRAIGLGVFFLLAAAAFAPLFMVRVPTRARWLAPARSQQRPAAPAGHRDRRRDRCAVRGFLRHRAVARPCRARARRRQDAEGRHAGAARRVARSICVARARGRAGGGDVLRRRQRPPEADRRRVRLAGRDGAGQFPHRCLGVAADLYRQAAGDPAGPARRRADPGRRRDGGAGRQHAGHPRDRPGAARRGHERRPRGAKVGRPEGRRRTAPRSAASSSTRRAPRRCAASPRAT